MTTPLRSDLIEIPEAGFLDHLEFLAQLSQSFVTSLDLDATLEQALRGIIRFLKVEAGTLFLLEEDGQALVCRASIGPVDIRGLRLRSDEGIVGRSVRRNSVEVVNDTRADANFLNRVDQQSGFITRSILCAPMTVGKERLGAIEVLNKIGGGPFDAHDMHLLRVMSSSAALAVSNARMAGALVEQERMRRELELAAEIQRSLLPRDDAGDFPIVGLNRPIGEVSGDFFDYFTLPDGRMPFALGDVSGKGLNAALLMAKTASLFRCLGKSVHDPATLLAYINREICETASRGMFVTMVAGTYDPTTGSLRFANAGHLPPLLRRTDRSYATFPVEAPPLGIVGDAMFENQETNLNGGEFYVFTDGLTEYRYGKTEELGVDGLIQMMEAHAGQSILDRLRALLSELDQAGWKARDDLTVLAIDDTWAARVLTDGPSRRGATKPPEPLLALRFPARADRLRAVRAAVLAAARMCGFDRTAAEDITLALGEACENVIVHAYKGRDDGEIELGVFRSDGGILLRLRDFAPPVDLARIRPRDLDVVRPGGLGTHFIRAIMDVAEYGRAPDGVGNLLQMTKRAS